MKSLLKTDSYSPKQVLSKNSKCGTSINLPIAGHCRPTTNCAFACYGRTGKCALTKAKNKAVWVSSYLAGKDISRLIGEAGQWTAVRLGGVGDFLPQHCPNVIRLALSCPKTEFWGMTRKLEIANLLNDKVKNLRMLVTVDATSPKETWDYQGKLCYGPRMPGDVVPADSRIVTVFPRHFAGRVVNKVDHHPKDCKAVWKLISGCSECGRCWKWS